MPNGGSELAADIGRAVSLTEFQAMADKIRALHTSTDVMDHYEFGCICGFRNHRLSECTCGAVTYDEGDIQRAYGPCPTLTILNAVLPARPVPHPVPGTSTINP